MKVYCEYELSTGVFTSLRVQMDPSEPAPSARPGKGWHDGEVDCESQRVDVPGDTLVPWARPPVVKSFEDKVKDFERVIEDRLDAFARTRGYSDIARAAGYAGDPDPIFASEGGYCLQVRSATWRACYQILGDVQAGNRPEPTLDEVLAELPTLEWPVVTPPIP